MKLTLSTLQSLKLAQLKHLAVQCGINSGGTKGLLASRLRDELPQASLNSRLPVGSSDGIGETKGATDRILSVDMGIRNLAYCVLDLPASSGPRATPSILAWKRMAVSPTSTRPITAPPSTGDDSLKVKESFDPMTYASHAYQLLTQILLPHDASHVLIERQRYRSMGASAIQEWTVRVNMFEGMLYAVLRTLAQEGKWRGTVHSVLPAKVGPFWLDPLDGDDAREESLRRKTRRAKSAKARNKGAKIDLVGQWLEKGDVILVESTEARQTAAAYLDRWRGRAGRTKLKVTSTVTSKAKPKSTTHDPQAGPERSHDDEGEEGERVGQGEVDHGIGKLDDLADSLLQGVAWIRWQENRQRVMQGGIEALELNLDAESSPS
ncbi:MAG: hypothetical protein M1838_000117 [Thelocarpon superellum]|nr:MAG: hypothetical protein M1838_000117 [Thelocarpon superellum]